MSLLTKLLTTTLLCTFTCQNKTTPNSTTLCNPTNYPFLVSVIGETTCGGTVLTLEWVLTAASCLQKRIHNTTITVRAGFAAPEKHVQRRKAKKTITHPLFNPHAMRSRRPELRYDIALIQLDRPFRRSAHLNTAVLPTSGFTKKCTVGKTAGLAEAEWPFLPAEKPEKTFFERPLRCAEVSIVDAKRCSLTYPLSVMDDRVICTLEEEGGEDKCAGQTGGPLLCDKKVIGVVSRGLKCAIANVSMTYSRVESYLEFIRDAVDKRNEKDGVEKGVNFCSWFLGFFAVKMCSYEFVSL